MDLSLNGEMLVDEDSFKSLGSILSKNGGVVEDVTSRVNEGAKVSGALSRIWKVGSFGIGVKRMMYERIVVPTVTYGAEAWWLREGVKKRPKVFERKCLRKICGVTVMDRIRNVVIREEVGVMRDLAGRMESCVLRWFSHVERMDGERMAKRIYDSGVEGRRGRGRPIMGWMEGVILALRNRALTLEQAREIVHDSPVWRGLINGL